MTVKRMSATGIVTYWTTGETNLDKLRRACLAADSGLDKYIPESSTPMNALRQALESVFPSHLVRKLKGEGFAVVREARGKSENDYEVVTSAWFDDDDKIETSRCDAVQFTAINRAYSGHRGILQPVQVGVFLSRVLSEFLGGTMLRPKTGGVYWLPEDRADKWQKIADAVESANVVAGSSAVYVLRHQMDEAAIRAVRDALVNEVSGEAERINAEIISGELGVRALATREREAKQLIAKVSRYESLLDVTLASVRKSLGDVKDAAAAAALLAATADEEQTAGANAD